MKLRILFLFVLITACNQQKVTVDSDLNYLPHHPSTVFKINNLSNFKSELKNSNVLTKIKNTKIYKSITEKAKAAIEKVAAAQGFDYVLEAGGLIVAKGKDLLADVKAEMGI